MAFYRSDPEMTAHLKRVVNRFASEGRPNLLKNISINWVLYKDSTPFPGSGIGTGWLDNKLIYPASVVKLIYSIAVEVWLQKELIIDTPEMRRALREMIQQSSNDATSFIVDYLTGTTSGPSMTGESWLAWQKQRNLINKWLATFNWQELKGVNCCQKTWEDGPYGREKDFYGERNVNRNALSTSAAARILEGLMTETLLPPNASRRLKKILSRSTDLIQRKTDPENQIDGFLGEGLPKGSKLWNKAGWMSQARHDAAWICPPKGPPMLLVVFGEGTQISNDTFLLPALASELIKFHSQKTSS